MNLSYWEQNTWLSNIDYTIVGSGLTGLNCALRLKERFPEAKVLIVERGMLPNGASSKNAGFACFGSISEILDDLSSHSEDEVVELVMQRKKGLDRLRNTLGDENISFVNNGGYELFSRSNDLLYEKCISKIEYINELLHPVFKENVFSQQKNSFNFGNIKPRLIFNQFEGQLDTGNMMYSLLQKTQDQGIMILNNIQVRSFSETGSAVEVHTDHFDFYTKKLMIATNGFASQLKISEVKPARAQVLITKPINSLTVRGTFHLEEGYYYFRDVGNRILLGGGRNLAFQEEETTSLAQTELIQNKLEELLETTILPGQSISVDQRWSGIMGVGKQKKPLIKSIGENVYCGVRLGGMGVAIGSSVGRDLADLVD